MNKVIAIDGPAASGKGTLSRRLAEELNFAHMDTGALYRAVAYEVLQAGDDCENEADALAGCKALQGKMEHADVLSNDALRNDVIGDAASKVAVIQSVRDALTILQKSFAKMPGQGFSGAILDGRDIGTVICPDAPLKLYVTANVEIRAQRRMKELHSKGLDATYKAVLEDMRARDARDSGRKASPLRPAEDAVIMDSSDLNADQMVEKALKYAKKAFG
ncbi:MAG: cytidylate kinase [Zetaproteobacteria bacterium]|nr:MAG: cytidylate kinase [Zetaproteobacteria bacterium]